MPTWIELRIASHAAEIARLTAAIEELTRTCLCGTVRDTTTGGCPNCDTCPEETPDAT